MSQSLSFKVLGIPITATKLADAVSAIAANARQPRASVVFVRDVASLMAALDDGQLRSWHSQVFMTVPDGMPLVICGKLLAGRHNVGRVAGADLMSALTESREGEGLRHYFYGGKPAVAERVVVSLRRKNSNLQVCGTYAPPFREIDEINEFDADIAAEVEAIARAEADIVWIGISSPKQEYFMMRAAEHLERGVLIGVGAAFDFHAGTVSRAPLWMQKSCLEWLHRLMSEPRRLWRRYLIVAPRFVALVLKDSMLSAITPNSGSGAGGRVHWVADNAERTASGHCC